MILLIQHNKWKQPSTKPPPLEGESQNAENDELLMKERQSPLDTILTQTMIQKQ